MNANEHMTHVVDEMIAIMEAGAGEWHMPWSNDGTLGLPNNALTGAQYRGGNIIWLWMTQMEKGYPSARWATYKQWAELGAQVRKGEKATMGVVWKPIERTDETGEVVSRRGFYRAFWLFNAAQVDGDPMADAAQSQHDDVVASAPFASVPATIVFGAPAYSPTLDVVYMLPVATFHSEDDYLATLAHELAHWTGHSSRLNREFGKRFERSKYAAEELVAELSAAFTCSQLGIATARRTDHAAYLEHWIGMLKADPSILWSVASKAQAATDHIFSYSHAQEAAA